MEHVTITARLGLSTIPVELDDELELLELDWLDDALELELDNDDEVEDELVLDKLLKLLILELETEDVDDALLTSL